MIGENQPLSEIQTKINGLKAEMQEVLPAPFRHQLNADGQHEVYTYDEIALHWQQSFKTIDDLLARLASL